jgi:hypothetical protein
MPLWTPSLITTALWLDASDSSTLYDATSGGSLVAADGAIARWEDKSGNLRHATQGTIGSRPLRKTALQNSRDIVRLDGTGDIMNITPFTMTAGVTLFCVFTTQRNIGVSRDGGIVLFSSFNTFSPHFGGGPGGAKDWFDPFFSTSRPRVSTVQYTNTCTIASLEQTGTTLVGFVNGTQTDLSPASATFNGSPSLMSIGSNITSVFSQKDYCELALIQSPTTTSRQLMEGYLAHKWGIAANLPSGHPHKSVAPQFNNSTFQLGMPI